MVAAFSLSADGVHSAGVPDARVPLQVEQYASVFTAHFATEDRFGVAQQVAFCGQCATHVAVEWAILVNAEVVQRDDGADDVASGDQVRVNAQPCWLRATGNPAGEEPHNHILQHVL